MTFSLGFRKSNTTDTASRLAACLDYLAGHENELAARAAKYDSAVMRSTADPEIKTESLESRRAHAALVEQRANVERAQDAVRAAEKHHADAQERERRQKDVARWDDVEALAALRVTTADRLQAALAEAAKAREAFDQASIALWNAIPAAPRSTPGTDILSRYAEHADAEAVRAGVTSKRLNYPGPRPLSELCRGMAVMVSRLRPDSAKAN